MSNSSAQYIFANSYGLYKDAAGRGEKSRIEIKKGIRVCAVRMCHDSDDDEEGFYTTS
jgi:hypothetical protein